MVEIDLNHLYKKYPNAAQYSVKDFDLHIKNKEFIVWLRQVNNASHGRGP